MRIKTKIKLAKISIVMMFVGGSGMCAMPIQQTSSKNGIYLDNEKNLMWQDDVNAKVIRKSWDSAIDYCENLTLAGYSDWYLPNKANLEILYKQKTLLKNQLSSGYWSSNLAVGKSDASWIISFSDGKEAWRSQKIPFNVRCVRGR